MSQNRTETTGARLSSSSETNWIPVASQPSAPCAYQVNDGNLVPRSVLFHRVEREISIVPRKVGLATVHGRIDHVVAAGNIANNDVSAEECAHSSAILGHQRPFASSERTRCNGRCRKNRVAVLEKVVVALDGQNQISAVNRSPAQIVAQFG